YAPRANVACGSIWLGVSTCRDTVISARTGVSSVLYSVSVTLRLLTVTGQIRNGPQKNNTVGSLLGGLTNFVEALPARLARSIVMADFGTISSSSAESAGRTPLAAAIGLLSASWSEASSLRVKLKVSVGAAACCVASTWPVPTGVIGGWTKRGVRDTLSGLNWKMTMFGKPPSSPAPRLMKAPFKVAIGSYLQMRGECLEPSAGDPPSR